MQPQFVTKPAFTVVGMLIHTKPMSPKIPEMWQEFGPRMGEMPHLAEPGASFGLMGHYDQQTGIFDYMAGEAVTQVSNLPAGMTSWDVPANTYAVFEATLLTLSQTFGDIYGTWLPASGYQQATGPSFEFYSKTFNPDDPTSIVSIYIPVEKKA